MHPTSCIVQCASCNVAEPRAIFGVRRHLTARDGIPQDFCLLVHGFPSGPDQSAARHSSVMNLFPAFTRSEPHGFARSQCRQLQQRLC
jgi:hypothetical protein